MRQFGIIAYRGLWDRFAPPNSIAAFRRSLVKRVPFIIDLTSGAVDLNGILEEGLLSGDGIPIFIKYSDPGVVHSVGRVVKNSSVYFINCQDGDGSMLEITREGGTDGFDVCGVYLPLGYYLTRISGYPANERTTLTGDGTDGCSFAVYESLDTLQALRDMKRYSQVRDSEILSFLMRRYGKERIFMKASDLVERDFLMSQMEA